MLINNAPELTKVIITLGIATTADHHQHHEHCLSSSLWLALLLYHCHHHHHTCTSSLAQWPSSIFIIIIMIGTVAPSLSSPSSQLLIITSTMTITYLHHHHYDWQCYSVTIISPSSPKITIITTTVITMSNLLHLSLSKGLEFLLFHCLSTLLNNIVLYSFYIVLCVPYANEGWVFSQIKWNIQ